MKDSETWIIILQIDPLLPITPARPRPKKAGAVTPMPQFAQSKNRRAATVLFTPRKQAQAHSTHAQPSPTPQSSSQTYDSHQGSFPISIGSTSSIEQEMEHLDLGSESESESSEEEPQAEELNKAKKKGRGLAEDVWNFFEKGMGGKESFCKFCM